MCTYNITVKYAYEYKCTNVNNCDMLKVITRKKEKNNRMTSFIFALRFVGLGSLN